jgi:hypothetical protein
MLVLLLLLCCCSISILGGGYYYVSGLPDEPDTELDEKELESVQDKAYEREMGKIITEMKEETGEASDASKKVAVARQALERATFEAKDVGDAFKTVIESSKKLAEAKAQVLVYQGFVDTATYDDEKAIWQQAVDETQKKIDYFQTTYNEAKKAADDAAAALREEAKKKADADAAAKEAAIKAEEAREAQREAERKAKELATLREGCKNTVWNNVFVDGRVGRDISFAGQSSFNTQGQTITKGNVNITFGGGKTIVSRKEMTGRDSRGTPIMSWRPKAEYDGVIVLEEDRVGYIPMTKKPKRQQPDACRQGRTSACLYDFGKFVEIHDFNDEKKEYLLMAHNSYLGVMQGDTGKFYSIPDKKVIDNPYKSDCQTKLDYK